MWGVNGRIMPRPQASGGKARTLNHWALLLAQRAKCAEPGFELMTPVSAQYSLTNDDDSNFLIIIPLTLLDRLMN